ncbi:MAG: hypothetical protein AB1641_18070 [Thermodesulfobacteriota bacterium]
MGLIRWVIIVLLFYLIYLVLKGMIRSAGPRHEGGERDRGQAAESQAAVDLVQDPLTGVYFPRSEGVASMVDGRILYFLNTENRDKYLLTRTGYRPGGEG